MPSPPPFAVEHVAFNVEDAAAIADWYSQHLGMTIIRQSDSNKMRFLADSTGRVVFELYSNPAAPIPNYAEQPPQVLYMAYAVECVKSARDTLLEAGATIVEDYNQADNGDEFVMLRDPWSLPIQLVKRADPML